MARDSREVWAKRVERWQDSGLTSTQFAAETGVNPRTLAYWKWRLAVDQQQRRRAPEARPRFVEVVQTPATAVVAAVGTPATAEAPTATVAAPAIADDEPLEVVLRDGMRIRVPVRFNGDALRRVVAALAVAR